MQHLGFTSCKADPDIWMRPAQKDDGSHYWEDVLLYVDDALCISNDAENVLKNQIGRYFVIRMDLSVLQLFTLEIKSRKLLLRMKLKLGRLVHRNMFRMR